MYGYQATSSSAATSGSMGGMGSIGSMGSMSMGSMGSGSDGSSGDGDVDEEKSPMNSTTIFHILLIDEDVHLGHLTRSLLQAQMALLEGHSGRQAFILLLYFGCWVILLY